MHQVFSYRGTWRCTPRKSGPARHALARRVQQDADVRKTSAAQPASVMLVNKSNTEPCSDKRAQRHPTRQTSRTMFQLYFDC